MSRALAAYFALNLALCLVPGAGQSHAQAEPAAHEEAQLEWPDLPLEGDPQRGRLVFGSCRTCHYTDPRMGHNNGPSLHRIFGKTAGKQPGFDYYSATFRDASFVWTPRFMYAWLANPMAMFPTSSMMSLGVPDPQRRADLIAYLEWATARGE